MLAEPLQETGVLAHEQLAELESGSVSIENSESFNCMEVAVTQT